MPMYVHRHTHIYICIYLPGPGGGAEQPRVSRRPPGAGEAAAGRPSPLLPRGIGQALCVGLPWASFLLLLPKSPSPFIFDHDSVTLLVKQRWCSEIRKWGKTQIFFFCCYFYLLKKGALVEDGVSSLWMPSEMLFILAWFLNKACLPKIVSWPIAWCKLQHAVVPEMKCIFRSLQIYGFCLQCCWDRLSWVNISMCVHCREDGSLA